MARAMTENATVSVILTSYNKPSFLERAIKSVLAQTYKDFQLIIAEDNSPNKNVWNVINSFKDSRIISFDSCIKEEDRLKTARYATQINTAVQDYSTSKYICYLADDDFFYPEMLKYMIAFAEKENHHAVFCSQHLLNQNSEVTGARWYNEPLKTGFNVLDHSQVMTTRNLFNLVGGWNDDPSCWSGADAYFFQRIEQHNNMFYPIDYAEPLQAKTYRKNSVQWNIFNGMEPTHME